MMYLLWRYGEEVQEVQEVHKVQEVQDRGKWRYEATSCSTVSFVSSR